MSAPSHAEAHEAPSAPPSMFVTVIGGLGMLTIFIGIVMLFIGRGAYSFQDVDAERDTERYKILEDVKAGVKKAQEAPTWVNKDKGTVSLSFEKSIALTEATLKAKKPTPGIPIPTPAPAAAAPATPAR